MGRGGDQIPFLDKGYPAVRITVAVEDYEHQHQDLRTEDGTKYGDTVDELDFNYLTRASQLNVRALHNLAMAPMPPSVFADAAVRVDTEVKWQAVPGADTYAVFKRRTDEPYWRNGEQALVYIDGPASANNKAAEEVREFNYVSKERGDDWLFGASACSTGSYCSPVSSAVPGGAFEPVTRE